MKKFKSFVAVLLCLAAVFCTAGCSASKKSALNISGAQIDYETFLYYFDQVHAFPEKYELAADATNEQMIDAAIELCCEYVAVNTKLSEYGLTLSASEKRSASNNLEDLWHVFSGYYEKLGVSKQTLMKIETADTSRNRLFYYIYDEGGEKAVSEDDIKKYYNENYISFRAITGYLTTTDANGDTVVMTADQKAAMNKEFMELSTRLGNGQTMNEIVELYSKKHPDSTVSDQLQFIKKGTDSYPEGFFEKVQQLSVGSNTVLIMDNYIFLILRENPSEDEAKQYYDRYRDDCLKSLRGDEFKTIVEGYASELSVERNDRVINKAVKEVLKDGSARHADCGGDDGSERAQLPALPCQIHMQRRYAAPDADRFQEYRRLGHSRSHAKRQEPVLSQCASVRRNIRKARQSDGCRNHGREHMHRRKGTRARYMYSRQRGRAV